jgi:hypothetical protein
MTLAGNTQSFATEVGLDIASIYTLITGAANIANLQDLDTTAKTSLIAAINEVLALAESAATSGGAIIDDATPRATTTYSSEKSTAVATTAATNAAAALISDGTTAGTTTWSSTKINDAIGVVVGQVQTIIAGSPEAYNTFKEVSDYIANDVSGAEAITASIQNRLRVDAPQTFTGAQLTNGLANLVSLGVAKQADLQAFITSVGNPETDILQAYLTARNA